MARWSVFSSESSPVETQGSVLARFGRALTDFLYDFVYVHFHQNQVQFSWLPVAKSATQNPPADHWRDYFPRVSNVSERQTYLCRFMPKQRLIIYHHSMKYTIWTRFPFSFVKIVKLQKTVIPQSCGSSRWPKMCFMSDLNSSIAMFP